MEELAFRKSREHLSVVTGEKTRYWGIDSKRLVLDGRIMRKFSFVCFNLSLTKKQGHQLKLRRWEKTRKCRQGAQID